MFQAELQVLGGNYQGKAIPLTTKRFLAAREQDCHLRPNSDSVSRHHCVFLVDDYGVRLRDLGSTNGTRVNGETIRSETVLSDGDQITIGKLQLQLGIRKVEAAAVAPSAPPPAPEFEAPINQAGAETMFEMPVLPEAALTATNFTNDTAIMGGVPVPPGYPQAAPPYGVPGQMPGYPMGLPAAPMAPAALPPGAIPGYGMPAPYPGYAPAPGYGAPYPGQMPGYPAGYGAPAYPMAQPYPMAPPVGIPVAAPVAEPAVDQAAIAAAIPTKLPPPESTGAKAPAAPAPVAAPAAGGAAPTPEKPSQSAADIIKQYMQRRTTR